MSILEQLEIGPIEYAAAITFFSVVLIGVNWHILSYAFTYKARKKAANLEMERERFASMHDDIVRARDTLNLCFDNPPSLGVQVKIVGELAVLQRSLSRLEIWSPKINPIAEGEKFESKTTVEWLSFLMIMAEQSSSRDLEGARDLSTLEQLITPK